MGEFIIVYGCMFSGKTTRLIEYYNNSSLPADEKLAVKPLIDNRYIANKIHSHSGIQLPGHRISKADEIQPLLSDNIKEIYIDEIQFLGKEIYDIVLGLKLNGYRVIASGLDKDYMGQDFGEMPRLIKLANSREELTANCSVCGKAATMTYRVSDSTDLILIGHGNDYEARCKAHWDEGMSSRLSNQQQEQY